MSDNVIQFPETRSYNKRLDDILDQSLELKERSEALLEWAEEMMNQMSANDNER
jgi:hypothetical protein